VKPCISKESQKWEKLWGTEVALQLVQYAENAMADYEYMYQYRL
jgi:hypothetical protein